MIEVAVAYVGAYLGRKALKLGAKAGADIDSEIDAKLGQLYDWVRARLTDRPGGDVSLSLLADAPEGDKQQALVTEQLAEAVAGDDAAGSELQAFVEELDRLRPPGVTIEGLARAEDLYGEQVGVEIEGTLQEGDSVKGESVATTVHEGAKSVGVKYRRLP